MKFNYLFAFAAVEDVPKRKLKVAVNGGEAKTVDLEDNQTTLEFAINEQVSIDLIDADAEGNDVKSRAILRTHKVTGAKFEPDTLEGTTITVSKVGETETTEAPPSEPPESTNDAPPWPSGPTQPPSEPPVVTDPANPDA